MRKFVILVVVAMFLGCVREPSVVVAPIVVEIPPVAASSSAPTVLPGAKREDGERVSFGGIEFRAPPGWVIDTSLDSSDMLAFHNAELDGRITLQINRVSWDDLAATMSDFIEFFREHLAALMVIDEMSIDQSLGRAVVRYRDTSMSRYVRSTRVLSPRNHRLWVFMSGDWPPESDRECNVVMGVLELSVTIPHEK